MTQFTAQATPPTFMPTGGNPLVLPPTSFFSNGVNSAPLSTTNPTGLEVIGGPVLSVPTTGLAFIDPSDPNNQYDPLQGLWVFRKDIRVLAQATVTPPAGMGAPVTAYVQETVTVRGAPLFAHAIFYAVDDLEIFPGPQMDIYGPVHSNKDLYVSNQSSATGLIFHDTVTTAGSVFHAWKDASNSSWGTGNETLGQNPVKFLSASGTTQTNMNRTGTAAGWMDSTTGLSNGVSGGTTLHNLETTSVTSTFRQQATQLWGGHLQTAAMGVSKYNPIAFDEVIGVNATTGENVTAEPHFIVDPPNPPATTDPYYEAKHEIELQKFSTQAALYIKVIMDDPAPGATPITNTPEIYGPSSTTGTGPNGYVLLKNPTNSTTPLISVEPYAATLTAVGAKITSGANNGKYPITRTPYNAAGAGTPVVTYSSTLPTAAKGGNITAGSSDLAVTSGMYDQRRGKGVDLVEIDITQLRAAVTNIINSTNNQNTIRNPDDTIFTGWNGGVYVEVNDPSTRGNTHDQASSVRLINGSVTSGSSLIPEYGPGGKGLTIATNAPLYIKGNFNADGTVAANSPTTPDDFATGATVDNTKESPVCIAADAITILSSSFADNTSADSNKPNAGGNTEIAAAFLTGNVPTHYDSSVKNSGGAHNLPRFLENWSGKTVAIRGSLVAMFTSKISDEPFSGAYYGAPNRAWGFDLLFKNGKFPPLTPRVYSFRRTSFSLLTPAQYAAAKTAMWP
ncbi:MAG: hypothetical protein WC378_07175 [Opitutaceae bacterium]|jgi:hypothetical protein